MKILQVCSKIPYKPKDGGGIAMKMLTDGLAAEGNTVHVISMSTSKHFVNEKNVDSEFKDRTAFESVFIDTSIKRLKAFLNLFSSRSYNLERFYSSEFEQTLIKKINSGNYDLIQMESVWVTPYLDAIRKNTKAKLVLRSHNIEYVIWERLAAIEVNPLKKIYLKLLASRLKHEEISLLNKFDAIVMITDGDADIYRKLGCRLPMFTAPFGIDLGAYKPDDSAVEMRSVFHIGAMDWQPNTDGVNWLLKEVWPLVLGKDPHVNLYLAGRNMPDDLKHIKMKNVLIAGEVADANDFINSKSIMVVPLHSGGGMRVKIIEGMALAKCIVSTTIGAEGIFCESGKNILLADKPEEFAGAIVKCLNDRAYCHELGKNARILAEEKYNNAYICHKLSAFYASL